jgi:quinohemoprotein ethanol dehydrogenase
MEMAAKTWTGEWWKLGGGGTAWDAITYDKDLNLIYIGAGNGSPWVQKYRSPGGGDNLFLASIIAVKADTGEYVWHFQEVPAEEYDYTATQPIVLADLTIDGKLRHVLMQAPKDGFFYVLDRVTGEFISAGQLVDQTWAKSLDPKTGRPTYNESARYDENSILITPALTGAHNWHPMAFSPKTGLMYLPINQNTGILAAVKDFKPQKNIINHGYGFNGTPAERAALQAKAAAKSSAWLSAWDPVTQTERWRVTYPSGSAAGVLATGGNLVFQGTRDMKFKAYRADTGEKMWEMPVDNIPIAAPITYTLDGEQYIALNAGYGGGLAHSELNSGRAPTISKARLLVFKLGGKAKLPPLPEEVRLPPPPHLPVTEAEIEKGQQLYDKYCQGCHGTAVRGGIKDLRYMTPATRDAFNDIVLKGIRKDQGMAPFSELTPADAQTLYRYIMTRAFEDYGQ